ncbi:MAG TPA: hypothetical protein PK514_04590 [Spirochaetota bacterium]|nr:hypothetical protein [Spirochaetota bacterium]
MERYKKSLIDTEKPSSCIFGSVKAPGSVTGMIYNCGAGHDGRAGL